MLNRKEIGSRLRELRGKRTQKEVANALGITFSAVSSYELGNRVPSDEMKVKLANYYDVNVQDIFFK